MGKPSRLTFLLVSALGSTACPKDSPAPPDPGAGGSAATAGNGGSRATAGSGGSQTAAGGSGGSQAGAGGSAGSSGSAGRTLSHSEFVFARLLRQGNSFDNHIHTYNLETGAETVVTTLDYRANTPGSGATIADLGVSSDRSQVVFSSARFRPDPVQVTESLRMDALWITDLEGKDFRRLTPDYKPDFNQGFPCGTNTPSTLPCLRGEVCRLNRCVREDLRVALTDMVWTPTGKIFHHSFHSWWQGLERVFQYGYVVSVTPDGRYESYDLPGNCRSVNPGAFIRSAQQLLIFRDGCDNGVQHGLILLSIDPFQERQVLIPESPELDMNVSRGRFSPDEKTFYFTAQGTTRNTVASNRRMGLYRLTLEDAQVQKLYESTVDNEDLADLAVLANGAIVVEVRTTAADRRETSRLARFQTTSNTLEYLPIQGEVRKPR